MTFSEETVESLSVLPVMLFCDTLAFLMETSISDMAFTCRCIPWLTVSNVTSSCRMAIATFPAVEFRPAMFSRSFSLRNERPEAMVPMPPGRHRYRLVVGGVWQADPYNEEHEVNEHGERNSVIVVPEDRAAP